MGLNCPRPALPPNLGTPGEPFPLTPQPSPPPTDLGTPGEPFPFAPQPSPAPDLGTPGSCLPSPLSASGSLTLTSSHRSLSSFRTRLVCSGV